MNEERCPENGTTEIVLKTDYGKTLHLYRTNAPLWVRRWLTYLTKQFPEGKITLEGKEFPYKILIGFPLLRYTVELGNNPPWLTECQNCPKMMKAFVEQLKTELKK